MRYRLGKKQKRVILTDSGKEVAYIMKDFAPLAQSIVNHLNAKILNEGIRVSRESNKPDAFENLYSTRPRR